MKYIDGDYINPEWDKYERVHCWRHYISDAMRDAWDTFSDYQKEIIAENAQEIADSEVWE